MGMEPVVPVDQSHYDFKSPYSTLLDPDYTYHYDKWSCSTWLFPVHVGLVWCIFFCGIICFVTRLVPRVKWMHLWFGRLYIILMMWASFAALLIHNTGLPGGVIVSFVWVIGGLMAGWFLINLHQLKMQKLASARAWDRLRSLFAEQGHTQGGADLNGMIQQEKGAIAAGKTFRERMLSYKAAHGALMAMSWFNIAGRIFATKGANYEDFTCHTYPYFKQIDTRHFEGAGKPAEPVPVHDPNFDRVPWAKTGLIPWCLMVSVGVALIAIAIGCCVARASEPKGAAEAEEKKPQEAHGMELQVHDTLRGA